MSQAELELFLDESGLFDDITERDQRISLVGGILAPGGMLTESKAKSILLSACQESGINWNGRGTLHGNELPPDKFPLFALSTFRQLTKENINFVIIENIERLQIVDPDITYLNMLAEGITQLFSTLNARYEPINLTIDAAKRMTKDKRYPDSTIDIKLQEYKTRLQERLHWAWLRRGMADGNKKWYIKKFITGSARDEYRLMLADVLCHAWFCKNTKFKGNQQSELLNLIDNYGYVYSVLEHGSISSVERLVASGSVGEAFYEACTCLLQDKNNQRITKKLYQIIQQIVDKLVDLPASGRNYHLNTIRGRVNYIITIDKHYDRALFLLDLINKHLLQPLDRLIAKSDKNFIYLASLETSSSVLAIANHRGNVCKAEQIINEVKKLIPALAERWENFQYIIDFLFWESVHHNNCYDFDETIKLMNKLEQFYNDTIELYPAALPGVFPDTLKSDLKGKILGNRLQAYMFKGRLEPGCYENARRDSDAALQEFTSFIDKSRHYMYRCHIETDAGNFTEALQYLSRGLNKEQRALDLPKIAAVLANDHNREFDFGLMHYARLMAAAVKAGCRDLAGNMAQAWQRHGLDSHPMLKDNYYDHPLEIVAWKLGSYYLSTGSVSAGLDWHRRSEEICFRDPDNMTLHTIGLGVLAEQAALLASAGNKYQKEYKHALKKAQKKLVSLLNQPGIPAAMANYLAEWPKVLQQAAQKQDSDIITRLARLAHMIPF